MRFDWLIDGSADKERTGPAVVSVGGGIRMETVGLGRGLDVKRVWVEAMDEPIDVHVRDLDTPASQVNLVVPIETTLGVRVPGVDRPGQSRGDTHFWHLPEERWADYHVPAGTPVTTGSLGISLEFLEEIARCQRLPEPLAGLLEKGRSAPFCLTPRTGPRLYQAVRALLDSPYDGPMAMLFSEAKGMEIAAHALAALQAPEPARRPALSAWEVRRIHEAKERLTLDPRSPPTVRELAHGVGLSMAQLQYGFREVFGAPVFRWLQEYKLDLARELLEKESVPIKQIAFRLGYSHQNNFTNAFRRRFGIPPGAVRRGRSP